MISSITEYFNHFDNQLNPLDTQISTDLYCPLDLGIANKEIETIDIVNPQVCQQYIHKILQRNRAKVAFGGYLERRNLYADKSNFSSDSLPRNIHLGIDFWTAAGTKVIAPIKGRVHSFQNNKTIGDYGPTIILQHEIDGFAFHTLYGHLSLESIENLQVGQKFQKGDTLATLGTPEINVNYAPHLHFQIVIDMQGMEGDYPGVCSEDMLEFYTQNCPNPNMLLNC